MPEEKGTPRKNGPVVPREKGITVEKEVGPAVPERKGDRGEKLQGSSKDGRIIEGARLHCKVAADCPGTNPLALWATGVRTRHAEADSVGINVHAAW